MLNTLRDTSQNKRKNQIVSIYFVGILMHLTILPLIWSMRELPRDHGDPFGIENNP